MKKLLLLTLLAFGFNQECSNQNNISSASMYNLVLLENQTVFAWGTNFNGETTVPEGLENVVAVSAGWYNNVLALLSDGTVVAWGNNPGQLTVPEGLEDVIAISSGIEHSLALLSDGTVVAWGSNSSGQSTVPEGLENVVAISAGDTYSLALLSDGTVVGWGSSHGSQVSVPQSLENVIAIEKGGQEFMLSDEHTNNLALLSDSTVVAWRNNGEILDILPEGLENVVAISKGGYHSLALLENGTVVAWGDNDFFNNDYGQVVIPEGLENVVAISAGPHSSLALLCDGTLVSWGDNLYGIPDGLDSVLVCDFYDCLGCTDSNSCDYNPDATIDDGSCIYPEPGYDCDGEMIDCAEESYISIIDDEGFAQIAESEYCYQFTLIVDAYNSFNSSNLTVGDFIYLSTDEVTDEFFIVDINNTGSFAQFKVIKYDSLPENTAIVGDCSGESFTTIVPQTNITIMNILNYLDECGICDGPGLNDEDCCGDDSVDCNGVCGGEAYVDMCGICDSDTGNDCPQDECGNWGGSGYIDDCGVCDDDPSNDCAPDCNGDWGGQYYL